MRRSMTIRNKDKAWLFIPNYLIHSYLSVLKSHNLMPSPAAVVRKRLYASGCWVLKDDPCKTINQFQVTILMALIIYRIIEYLEIWKRSIGVIESSSLLLAELCHMIKSIVQMLFELWQDWCWDHLPKDLVGPVTNRHLSAEFSPSKK